MFDGLCGPFVEAWPTETHMVVPAVLSLRESKEVVLGSEGRVLARSAFTLVRLF